MEFLSLLGYLILVVSISPCLAKYKISDYRFITKDRPNAGIIEVFVQGIGWGIVCQDPWSFELASVVCHQLNFPGTSRNLKAGSFNDEEDNWPLSVTDNVTTYYAECTKNEMNMYCDTCKSDCNCDKEYWIAAVTCKEPGYLGCFTDPGSFIRPRDRVLSSGPHDKGALTIDLCITMCKERGFFYAGVEYTYECFCGRQSEMYDRHGLLSDGECDDVCSGDRLESCGAGHKIAVYQVNLGVCNDPGTPTNGFRYNETDSLRYGSKLYFNCSDGYILEGPEDIQCVKKYGGGEDLGITNSSHAVTWNNDPPSCTRMGSTISSTRSTVITKGLAPTNQGTRRVFGPEKQEGHQSIIYIWMGIASGLVIIVVIIVAVVARKRHKRRAENQDPVIPRTDNGLASPNHGDGGDNPLVPRANGEEDLFILTELTSHSDTKGKNHYTGGTDERPPAQPGSVDRPGISRDAFGYESIRLPSADSAPDWLGGTVGDDSVGGATDLYANTEFHDVPTNLIDNELYG